MENAEPNYWIVLEVGKAVREADSEVSEAIDFSLLCLRDGTVRPGYNYDLAGETNRYHYQPRGIVVVIFWNFRWRSLLE